MTDLQFDHETRIVSEANLSAMCARASGMCHRYSVTIKGRYARIEYSNPDEYGHESPMVALLPLVPYAGTNGIVLTIHRVLYDNWDGEGWQAFDPVIQGETLWRSPDDNKWRTRAEIETAE